MNCYVRSGIDILKDTTKELENLNELGIYLAKQTDTNAIKSLKLLILATKTNLLNKEFDINSVKSYTQTFMDGTYKKNESVIGNLSVNPQNIALELMDYILQNFQVDLTLEPHANGYTIFDYWVRSFARIEYDQDRFYKRYDIIDKKISMVSYLLRNRLLNASQIEYLLDSLDICIQKRYSYTKEQLSKMENMVNYVQLAKELEILKEFSLTERTLEPFNRRKYFDDLIDYQMLNDQCVYMLDTIPTLVREKIIK